MPTVWIPAQMRDLTGGEARVAVTGRNLREVIQNLDARCPGVAERLIEGGRLSPLVNIAVDSEVSNLGLLQPVRDDSEIHFIPAVSGGR